SVRRDLLRNDSDWFNSDAGLDSRSVHLYSTGDRRQLDVSVFYSVFAARSTRRRGTRANAAFPRSASCAVVSAALVSLGASSLSRSPAPKLARISPAVGPIL